jgi:NAD(P)-dependent dehydrogenase (short-subunit alcohol dehydrogenase family)
VEQAAERLGGIDGLVYATGVGTLARLVDTDAATWRHAFDTNVIGASLVTAAAVPHLASSRGAAAYLSSVSASVTPPWPGLGSYAVSKAALDTLVEAWRAEHPSVGFTRVVVGDCAGGEGPSGTEFINSWDLELMAELHPIWTARNYLSGSLLDVRELARVVDMVLRCGATASIPSVTVVPRPGQGPPPVMPTASG